MVTVISRFRVRNGLEEEVRDAFVKRPRLVEETAGFCGLEVLTDAKDPAVFLLVTRWTDEPSFQTWHRSDAHHQSHSAMPHGLKLDATFTTLTIGNRIDDPRGTQTISDALEGQTVELCRWLMESDAVLALLLAPDGTIRARNHAAYLVLPPDPAKEGGDCIWDYLVCSDVEVLRHRWLDTGTQPEGRLLLNLTDEQRSPITLEARMIRCSGAVLLLGVQERRRDSQFQNEILKLTNDLSLAMRESSRKNRELAEAYKTIELLARTDGLTGLANRRTLDETLQREVARAQRMEGRLSLIMADLDHFKSINDQYGHSTGDQVLAGAAAVLAAESRPYDLAARYGGEEFVLLLPGTSQDEAIAIAERIRKEIGIIEVPECDRQITVSLGVAGWISGETGQQLVSRADAALYKAKSTGRNRVEAAACADSGREQE